MRTTIKIAIASISLAGFMSCQSAANKQQAAANSSESSAAAFSVDTLAKGLENPWGITWISNDKALITERKGKVLILDNDKLSADTIQGLPAPYLNGQSGYLDIKTHPDYASNGWIYMTYAKKGNGGGSTSLARFKLEGNKAVEFQDLLQTLPISDATVHFGSRIVFDNDNYVYFSAGERGTKENAQDLTNDMGKVHRLKDDGTIPSDNPFVNQKGARPSIWSYGNRNIQGMTYDSKNNVIYATEHGPKGGDELNIIKKGANYGWPLVTYGIDYNDSIISDIQVKEGIENPVHYWVPSIATCGLLFYTGDKFPQWDGSIFSGALAKMHVARVVQKDGKFQEEGKMLENLGRVRQVAQSPDGYIYVLTEGPGLIVKLK